MYTSFIGKKFLALWNQRMGKNLTARDFFDEVLFPIFFNDERHLMHVGQSPFFQGLSEEDRKKGLPEPEIRRLKLHEKIATDVPNMAIYVGYAAKEHTETTSGQLTNMPGRPSEQPTAQTTLFPSEIRFSPLAISPEEMYASWIGQGLAIGINGGICWLIDDERILWHLYEGWPVYRKYLSQTPGLKGRQIETWNGQWLKHRLEGLSEADFKLEPTEGMKEGTLAIPTLQWTKLLLSLCRKFPREIMTVYAYNLSQTNTTLGFFNFYLPEVHRMYEMRDQLFLNRQEAGLTDEEIEDLEPYFSFTRACELGAIGLRAIEPKKLREYYPKKDGKQKNVESLLKGEYKQFHIFKLWICAMINKKEILDSAINLAEILLKFEKASSNRGKTKEERLTEQVRTASNLRLFADALGELVEQAAHLSEIPKEYLSIVQEVLHEVVKMPSDQFPLFAALLRFEYAYLKASSN